MIPVLPCLRVLTACLPLLLVLPTTAAPITWGAATATSDKSQLIEGAVVFAFSAGDEASITGGGASGTSNYSFVGGNYTDLVFAPAPGARSTSDISNGASSTGDAGFDTIIKSFADSQVGITNGVQTIGGLVDGEDYRIQVFFNDQRAAYIGRVMTYGDDGSPASRVQLSAGGSGWGQHAVGSFTASGVTQALSHTANGFGNVHFNAILVTRSGPPPLPDVPTDLVATAGDGKVGLDWDDNKQFGFSHFIVRRSLKSGGPFTDLPGVQPSESEFVDSGVSNGTTYYYVVAAENSLGQVSAESVEDSATPEVIVPDPPIVPLGLTVTAGNHRNSLNWDDNHQPGFLEFRVKRATVSGGPYTQIGETEVSAFSDTSAANGETYYYVVTTVNSDGLESEPSEEEEGTPEASNAPPNFLFIITDDQDTYSVGAYRRSEPVEASADGQAYTIDTPNIDRLAAEGMMFHQARLMGSDVGAVCTASRTCIMTGKNSWQRTQGASAPYTFPGIFNRGVRSGLSTLPYATYRTCKVGNSYGVANSEFTIVNDATKRGNTDGSGSEWHGDRALDHFEHWRANHQANGKPFLMYLGFSHPHDTRNARTSPRLTSRYNCLNTTNPAGIRLNSGAPPLPLNHLSCTPATFPAHPFDNGHLYVRDEISASGIDKYRTEAVIRNEIGRNFACVDWIDQQVGRVLAKLEDPNGDGDTSDSVIENTYIVFTSDHGISIGRHGLQGKQNLYEHTWRVPYIVRGPGIEAGSENDALIYLHDTFPTFCDLAGIDLPATIDGNDGRSFRSVLEGSSTTARDHLYGLYAGGSKPGMRSVTDGRFKLIKYDVDSNVTQVTQLFDLQEDPFELLPQHGAVDLATYPAYAGIRAGLEAQMMLERRETVDPYQLLGDRTLLRFEEGPGGATATILHDRLPWGNDGVNSGAVYSNEVPYAVDRVQGEANTLSLDLDPGDKVTVADDRALDMGSEPFTLEAYVKLDALPAAGAAIPLISKGGDYIFYVGGGGVGNPDNGLSIRLGSSLVHSSLSIDDSNWHYVSVALNQVTDRIRFVVDDRVEVLRTTATGSVNRTSVTLAGGAFDGLLDEVSITVGYLSEAELQPVDPTPAEEFQITSFRLDPANPSELELSFESKDSRMYTIQSSADLDAGEWTDVRSFVPGALGAAETMVSGLPVEAGALREFYRVTVEEGE